MNLKCRYSAILVFCAWCEDRSVKYKVSMQFHMWYMHSLPCVSSGLFEHVQANMVKVPLRCVFEDFGSHTGEKKDVSEICLGSTWQKRLCHQFLGGFSRSECVCAIFAGSRTPPSTDGNPPRNWGLNCAIYFGNSVILLIMHDSALFLGCLDHSMLSSPQDTTGKLNETKKVYEHI